MDCCDDSPWCCWEWEPVGTSSASSLDWQPEEAHCATTEWCFDPTFSGDLIAGGWLADDASPQPDDGGDCAEDGDEDYMLFVFNYGGDANSNGFVDAAGDGVYPALINRPLEDSTCGAAMVGYERKWAREFRYDGDRQRYLSRALDLVTLGRVSEGEVWTTYAGDTPMVDYSDASTPPVNKFSYVPGVAEVGLSTSSKHYLHMDHLGSTWFKTPALGDATPTRRVVRTAFGEVVFIESGP